LEQEDYIKKQIDKLGQVLGKILADLLGFKNQADILSGIESVNQAFKSELDLDLEELITVSPEKFMNTLLETKKFSEENLEKLSNIFLHLAKETDQGNLENERVKSLYKKSLCILEHIDRISSCYSVERNSKIEDIKTRID
jgi:hypothetical protein